jgi:hypothetical protein
LIESFGPGISSTHGMKPRSPLWHVVILGALATTTLAYAIVGSPKPKTGLGQPKVSFEPAAFGVSPQSPAVPKSVYTAAPYSMVVIVPPTLDEEILIPAPDCLSSKMPCVRPELWLKRR